MYFPMRTNAYARAKPAQRLYCPTAPLAPLFSIEFHQIEIIHLHFTYRPQHTQICTQTEFFLVCQASAFIFHRPTTL